MENKEVLNKEEQLNFVKDNINVIAEKCVEFQEFIPLLCEMLNEYSNNVTKYEIAEEDVSKCSFFVANMLLPIIGASEVVAKEFIEKEELKNG